MLLFFNDFLDKEYVFICIVDSLQIVNLYCRLAVAILHNLSFKFIVAYTISYVQVYTNLTRRCDNNIYEKLFKVCFKTSFQARFKGMRTSFNCDCMFCNVYLHSKQIYDLRAHCCILLLWMVPNVLLCRQCILYINKLGVKVSCTETSISGLISIDHHQRTANLKQLGCFSDRARSETITPGTIGP